MTNRLYVVIAIAPSGNEKVVASKVGGIRATKLANEIVARGFKVRVEMFTVVNHDR